MVRLTFEKTLSDIFRRWRGIVFLIWNKIHNFLNSEKLWLYLSYLPPFELCFLFRSTFVVHTRTNIGVLFFKSFNKCFIVNCSYGNTCFLFLTFCINFFFVSDKDETDIFILDIEQYFSVVNGERIQHI